MFDIFISESCHLCCEISSAYLLDIREKTIKLYLNPTLKTKHKLYCSGIWIEYKEVMKEYKGHYL